MYLLKASGSTYRKVLKQGLHAFHGRPAEMHAHELVLLSKNKADCAPTEAQIAYVAKVVNVRAATPTELESAFPGEAAGQRWDHVVELYAISELARKFNLSGVPGFNWKRYAQVQAFAKLDSVDELAVVGHLQRSNESVLLDLMNNAKRPPDDARR